MLQSDAKVASKESLCLTAGNFFCYLDSFLMQT